MITIYGLDTDAPGVPAAGTGIFLACLIALCSAIICTRLTDTTREQDALRRAREQLEEERGGYIAARAALEVERDRIRRDLVEGLQQAREQLDAERDAMQQQFDDQLAAVKRQAVAVGIEMALSGGLDVEEPMSGRLIRFPAREPRGDAPAIGKGAMPS